MAGSQVANGESQRRGSLPPGPARAVTQGSELSAESDWRPPWLCPSALTYSPADPGLRLPLAPAAQRSPCRILAREPRRTAPGPSAAPWPGPPFPSCGSVSPGNFSGISSGGSTGRGASCRCPEAHGNATNTRRPSRSGQSSPLSTLSRRLLRLSGSCPWDPGPWLCWGRAGPQALPTDPTTPAGARGRGLMGHRDPHAHRHRRGCARARAPGQEAAPLRNAQGAGRVPGSRALGF